MMPSDAMQIDAMLIGTLPWILDLFWRILDLGVSYLGTLIACTEDPEDGIM